MSAAARAHPGDGGADAFALLRVQNAYASALDRRDGAALGELFHIDAVFRLLAPGASEPHRVLEGRGHIEAMTDAMAERYVMTRHVLSNHTSTVDGDDATGAVYCNAHHLEKGDGQRRDLVVHLIYDDVFRRSDDGRWRIARRDVCFQWITEQPIVPWERGAPG